MHQANIMRKLSFEEITDWEQFENLVAAYFRSLDSDQNKNVILAEVNQSGKGSDGGRDILLEVSSKRFGQTIHKNLGCAMQILRKRFEKVRFSRH
ncbi:MAG: hypothetical protein IPM82_14640 [Saprospiraceae bacterium]|nr:hypothetical protein [Saprospiraceae bacterium]